MQAYNYTLVREPVAEYQVCSANNPKDVANYLFDLGLAEYQQEHFYVLMLDVKNQVIGHSLVTSVG